MNSLRHTFLLTYHPLFLVIFLALLSACSTGSKSRSEFLNSQGSNSSLTFEASEGQTSKNLKADPQSEVIRPGYVLKWSQPNDPSFSGSNRVNHLGELELPFSKKLFVADMGVRQLEKKLSEIYRDYYKDTPSIKIQVVERSVSLHISGLVQKPTMVRAGNKISLEYLISQAGGFYSDNKPKVAQIIQPEYRKGVPNREIDLDAYFGAGLIGENLVWLGGEKVFFQKEKSLNPAMESEGIAKIHLLGDVRQPGDFLFREGESFYYYLKSAGGPSPTALLKEVQLIRQVNGEKVERSIVFDASDPESIIPLQAGDILIVGSDRTPEYQKVLTAGASAASITSVIILIFTLIL